VFDTCLLRCEAIETALDRIGQKGEILMAKFTDMKGLVNAIRTETDDLALRVDAIINKVSDSSMTGAEEDEILTDLTALKARLSVIGKDAADPIPDENP